MKKMVGFLAASLLTIGIVVALWLQLRDSRAQIAALQERVTALEKTRQSAFRFALPPAPATDTTTASGDSKGGAPQPTQQRAERVAALRERSQGLRQMISSPEVQEMARSTIRMRLPQQYPDIGKELHLSPEEVEKLFDLLAKQQSGQLTTALSASDPQAAQQKRQENEAELTAMLGGRYSQWQTYQETLPTRRQVNQLQTMLGASGNTLSDTQTNPLITALASEQKRIDQEMQARYPGNVLQQRLQGATESSQRLLNVAATQLNPQQLDGYKKMLDQQQNTARMAERFMGRLGGAAGQARAAAGTPR
jgi:hypothetical protein